jgi:PAS domain S-box-containing protein
VNVNLEERAEARARELARANDLVAAVLECAPVPVMTMGPDGCVTGWNPAAERITGFSAAEVMGRRPLLSTADRDDLAQALHLVLRGKTVTNKDMRQQRKDGSEIELMVSAAPLRNADGAVEGVVVIGLDVTELRATARQLQQAQKMEAVGQLTGGIAHEFNNLLAVIMGALDLLRLDLPADSNADALVGQAIAAVERGANLTTRLLAFARRQALRPSCTRVDRLVRELMPTLRTLVGETITVRELPTGAVWPTLVDRHQLTSAIVNVVANARDAMPKGGLLTLETCNAMLDATDVAGWPDATPGEFVAIRITDTGHGIEPETQARVFEPFFTTRAIGHGSGLGLSMVLGFVKQSGGHVRLSSTPGLGTTVVLYLPRLVAETAARPDLVSPDAGLAATGNSGPT